MSARFRIRRVFLWRPAAYGWGFESAPLWIVEDRESCATWRCNSHRAAIHLTDSLLRDEAAS